METDTVAPTEPDIPVETDTVSPTEPVEEVTEPEPEPEAEKTDSPLLSLKNPQRLRLSPHIAWASSQARERLVGQIAANISETFGI